MQKVLYLQGEKSRARRKPQESQTRDTYHRCEEKPCWRREHTTPFSQHALPLDWRREHEDRHFCPRRGAARAGWERGPQRTSPASGSNQWVKKAGPMAILVGLVPEPWNCSTGETVWSSWVEIKVGRLRKGANANGLLNSSVQAVWLWLDPRRMCLHHWSGEITLPGGRDRKLAQGVSGLSLIVFLHFFFLVPLFSPPYSVLKGEGRDPSLQSRVCSGPKDMSQGGTDVHAGLLFLQESEAIQPSLTTGVDSVDSQ